MKLTEPNLNFASDNTGPVAAPILAAMIDANAGAAMPYGNDTWMPVVLDTLRALFGWPDAEVLLVANGTGANALALAGLVRPWETVFAHRESHIERDEGGAPEFFTGGAKLTLLDGAAGRVEPASFAAAIARTGGAVHHVQHGALSLTNVTEMGTLYTLDDLDRLTGMARDAGIRRHLDGARFANAVVALGCSAADLVRGFDMVSFGATKNGCMGVEAIVIRDPARGHEMEMRRKRGAQLWSKHRFLSSQMAAYLADDLWLANARSANAMAARLAAGLRAAGAAMEWEPEANMIFCRLPRAAHARARAEAQYYLMDDAETPLCRLVCDFTKTEAEVDHLLALIAG